MPFNTALSGIRAASSELRITGNNIANASTTGFKASRAEFGDVYATSVLGSGSNSSGAGVQVQDVSQRFTQGNVTFTENELDLAINGNGFFVVSQDGETLYTRAGAFGLDDEGFMVSNSGARLQGFPSDSSGNIGGIQGDIEIQTSNLAPRQTTNVSSILNLDSTQDVLQSTGRQFVTEGNLIGVARSGLQAETSTSLTGAAFTLPLANDFSTTSIDFDLQLSAASGNNGTVSISLDTTAGVPATITTFNDVRTLASVINAQIFSPTLPQVPIDAVATAVDNLDGTYSIQFSALQGGESSSIALANQSANANLLGLNGTGTLNQGLPRVSNGYVAQSVNITNSNGVVVQYTSEANATAAATAAEMNAITGISATASTVSTISNYVNQNGNMTMNLNGIALTGDSLGVLATEINGYSNTILPGISAVHDVVAGTLTITSAVGDDIRLSIDGTDDLDSITVQGNLTADTQVLEIDTDGVLSDPATVVDASTNSVVVGGAMTITMDEGYSIGNESPLGQLFQLLGDSTDTANPVFSDVVINSFDPTDQSTYNSATSMTIYDSLGNSHVMTQYFVKQYYDPADPATTPNHWQVHVQIDGMDVGDPDISDPDADPTAPTDAAYNIYFNADGSFNDAASDDMLISNWTPLNDDGDSNGALGPLNVLAGGTTVFPDPPTSSNFLVSLDGTTQFGASFSVNDVDQNGFATGRLSGLSIDDSGIIFARFTNGESQTLGQIILADFTNQQGLQPVGSNMWAENFESGGPNIGTPNSAALGSIQSGALEESNVDLSEQLVNLIIAQRNFQASAKTIETASATTQTIINLR